MFIRVSVTLPVLLAVLCAAAGCKKSPRGDAPPVPNSQDAARKSAEPESKTLARVHWVGTKRLSADTNAAGLMRIWELPESGRLMDQTLNKLAEAPWRMLSGWTTNAVPTNAEMALLRGMLKDLPEEESYLEIGRGSNGLAETVFAIRLDPARVARWATNLAQVLKALTKIDPAPGAAASSNSTAWSLKKHDFPNLIDFRPAGDWALVGLSQDRNELLAEVAARVGDGSGAPCTEKITNAAVAGEVDCRRLASALRMGWRLPDTFPAVSFAVQPQDDMLRTSGALLFSRPLRIGMGEWQIPTNLISEPLVGFTAMRGFSNELSGLKLWEECGLGRSPDQLCLWTKATIPFQTYCAFPVSDSTNAISAISTWLLNDVNQWIRSHAVGQVETSTVFKGLAWTGVPFMMPFVQGIEAPGGDFVFAGLSLNVTNRPPPDELLEAITDDTDLIFYDWELTGMRIPQLVQVGQLLRVVARKAQLPPESASMLWLLALEPKLGNSVTVVRKTGDSELSIARKSTTGLTALELHLLADWLESPVFPRGSHSSWGRPTTLVPPGPKKPSQGPEER